MAPDRTQLEHKKYKRLVTELKKRRSEGESGVIDGTIMSDICNVVFLRFHIAKQNGHDSVGTCTGNNWER